MRVAIVLAIAALAMASGCSKSVVQPPDSPERAVRDHIEAAESGDVAELRRLACGGLAEKMAVRTDEQVRAAFETYYEPKPDDFAADTRTASAVTVLGFYTGITDMDIAFVTEQHGHWQVCEVRSGNGIFGPLPSPFE